MIKLTIAEVANVIGVQLPDTISQNPLPPFAFPSISIDSRTLSRGECFIAIQGDQLDGHNFIEAALQKGASVVIHSMSLSSCLHASQWREVTQPALVNNLSNGSTRKQPLFLQVTDTTVALQTLAHYIRKKWGNRVLAISGSVGKTTVREFTFTLLSQKFDVFQSFGNFNNEIGLPLSLLGLKEHNKIAVLELGMNHAGEIRTLGRLCAPDAALITNVAPVHLKFFSNLDEISAAKGEILECLPTAGLLFFNADDPRVCELAMRHPGKKISFGLENKANVRILNFEIQTLHNMEFEIAAWGKRFAASVPFAGQHFLYNLAAAVAVAFSFGLSQQQILEGISHLEPPLMRGRTFEVAKSATTPITIWDDSYNSNPNALRAVLDTIKRLKGFHHKILALGEMLELGSTTPELHRQAGGEVAHSDVDLLVTVGKTGLYIQEGAQAEGFLPNKTVNCDSVEQAADFLDTRIESGDLLVVKGSRGVQMERIIQRIQEKQTI